MKTFTVVVVFVLLAWVCVGQSLPECFTEAAYECTFSEVSSTPSYLGTFALPDVYGDVLIDAPESSPLHGKGFRVCERLSVNPSITFDNYGSTCNDTRGIVSCLSIEILCSVIVPQFDGFPSTTGRICCEATRDPSSSGAAVLPSLQ